MVQDIGRTYVRTINSIHGRSGTLWEGRFRSSLVDSENYLLACHRYIELNPVRAAMVTHPSEYAWSSHAHYALGNENPLLTEHECYRALGNQSERRRSAFADLLSEPLREDLVDEIRAAVNAGAALGSESFLARTTELVGRDVRIPVKGRPRKGLPQRN